MGRRAFSVEYRNEACKLVTEQGLSISEAAINLGIGKSTLDKWLRGYRESVKSGEPALMESEREELKRLRREVTRLRMRRDILKKATAFFANHSEKDVSAS